MVKSRAKFHFTQRQAAIPKPRYYVAFDTETRDDGSFICGAYYGVIPGRSEDTRVSKYCPDVNSFRETFLQIEQQVKARKRSFTLIGFNTAYDITYLGDIVDSALRLDAGSRFIQARTVNGTKILDISNHVIGSLEDWIERLKMQERYGICKRENYLDTEEGKRAQVLDDARATHILTKWVESNLIKKFGIGLTPTKFGAALKIFQLRYFKGKWARSGSEQWKNDFERQSYYGGRCEVFKRGLQSVTSYDVNSMYVAIMRDELIPNPSITKYLKNPEQIIGMIDTEFLTVDCRVRVPKTRIGLLPYRSDTGKLIFPWGEWRGTYNSVELREALKWGAEIVKVYRALWYPESDRYFRDYAQMTIDGRKQAKARGDAAEEQLYKYYGNGLYGKFGQRNTKGGQYVRLSQFKGDLKGLRIVPGADDYWVELPITGYEDSWHTFPVICATITAYARAKMLSALCHNAETAVYCDTDSLKCIGKAVGITVSDAPGDWGFEYEAEQEFYRPKRYADKRKGVPKNARLVAKTDDSETYEFERPTKFRTAIRQHCAQNVWRREIKTLSLIDDKREWLEDGSSYPLYVYVSEETTTDDSIPRSSAVSISSSAPL
jgi:hypothetical protein